MIKGSKANVIVASSHLLDGPMRGGIHYFAKYFEQRGNHVTFITVPLSPRHFFTKLGKFYFNLWSTPSTRQHIVHFSPIYPFAFSKIFRKFTFDTYLKLPLFDIRKKLLKYNLHKPDILFCEATLALTLHTVIDPKYFIIRFSDSLLDIGYKDDIINYCIKKAQLADLILVAAKGIKNELVQRGINTSKIFILPNGTDISEYECAYSQPVEYKSMAGPIAVYVGTLDIIDHELLKNVAHNTPDVNYFIIGPTDYKVQPSSPKNLIYAGFRMPKDVPKYLQNATIGITPIHKDRWGIVERHRKLYQYLAAGLLVVSTKGKYSQPTRFVTYVNNAEEFTQSIKDIKARKYDRKDVYKYAKTNFSWDSVFSRLDKILELLNVCYHE